MTQRRRWLSLAYTVALLAGTSAQADIVTFKKGSLIIPEQANFQTVCGATSAYGLVYRILQANSPGHYFDLKGHIVTVYEIIDPGKKSPNRCIPTNLNGPGKGSGAQPPGTAAQSASTAWLDGCDITIDNTVGGTPPVVPVVYSLAVPAAGTTYPAGAIPFLTPASGSAFPLYTQTQSAKALTQANGFTTIRYLGAPFVISADDAPYVLQFLKDGDSFTPTSRLVDFITPGTCSGLATSATAIVNHYVQMHQATIDFDANVFRRMNSKPPKMALLNTGFGITDNSIPAGGILNIYLNNANLYRATWDSGGCPVGTTSGCTLNGSNALVQNPGIIYDEFHANKDLVSTTANPDGLLNKLDTNGVPIYQMFWAPHWELATTPSPAPPYVGIGSGHASVERANVLENIKTFAKRQGSGVMAECASIASLESARDATNPQVSSYWNHTPHPSDSAMSAYLPRFLTTDGIAGTGPDTAANPPVTVWDGRNCTDPDYVSGQCMIYPTPTDSFAQIGDYHFTPMSGIVANWRPDTSVTSTAKFQPGITRLGVTWKDYTATTDINVTTANANNGWDVFNFGYFNNDSKQAGILYLGGHLYDSMAAGNRVVLNTLINLGFVPTGSERALSAPIAYEDPNIASGTDGHLAVYAGTYHAITGYLANQSTYSYDTGSQWIFPTNHGHFRASAVDKLSSGQNKFNTAEVWDVATLFKNATSGSGMMPGERNIFTYFGGAATTSTTAALITGATAPHGILQTGWVPEMVAGTAISPTCSATGNNSACVDVVKYDPDGSNQLVPGSDGICDLLQATSKTSVPPGLASYACTDASVVSLLREAPMTQMMLQRVRGYCHTTNNRLDAPLGSTCATTPSGVNCPNLTPAYTQCNGTSYTNTADLGGIVHSTPSVVIGTTSVKPVAGTRPTVAYVGGYDGMLHAILVSSASGGYEGPHFSSPADGSCTEPCLHFPLKTYSPATYTRPSGGSPATPSSIFPTDYAAKYKANSGLPAKGTELWAFVPPSQLPWFRSNDAQVDSAPVVMEAFVDLANRGVREWHTILVGSTGKFGREVYAIDVSDPTRPVLLWNVAGSMVQVGSSPQWSPIKLANTSLGRDSTHFSYKWSGPNALYNLFPANSDSGRTATGFYDFSSMGRASALSAGEMRAGTQPVYSVFVASTAGSSLTPPSGFASTPQVGLEVFAIDIGTGQKLWQWEQPYVTNVNDPDFVPPVSLAYSADGVSSVYVGDMEGRVWELDPLSGTNRNNLNQDASRCASPPCNYPAFDTGAAATCSSPTLSCTRKTASTGTYVAQPVSTNLSIARVPSTVTTGSFAPYRNSNVLVFGTAGQSWVDTSVGSKLHVALLDDRFRVPVRTGLGSKLAASPTANAPFDSATNWTGATALTAAQTGGVLQEARPSTTFPLSMASGEHLYGQITVAGQTLIYESANGAVNTDVNKIDSLTSGKTYSLNLGGTISGPSALGGFNLGNFGGTAVLHVLGAGGTTSTDYVIGAEVSKLTVMSVSNPTAVGDLSPDKNKSPASGAHGGLLFELKSWLLRAVDR